MMGDDVPNDELNVSADGRGVTSDEPFVDGFLPSGTGSGRGAEAQGIGRPADVLQLHDGSILISDDAGNRLLRVSCRQWRATLSAAARRSEPFGPETRRVRHWRAAEEPAVLAAELRRA
jgi:hypothetical protein